jgi:hypothetical protein
MDKCYKIFPGSRNGLICWLIEYEDGTNEHIPFYEADIIESKIKERVDIYLMKKRTEKLKSIISKIENV